MAFRQSTLILVCIFAIRCSDQAVFAQGSIDVRPPIAIPGEPFGVLQLEIPIPRQSSGDARIGQGKLRVSVRDADDRVFYPAVSTRTVEVSNRRERPRVGRRGGLIDRIRNAITATDSRQVPVALEISALFRGNQPIELEISGDIAQVVRINPQRALQGGSSNRRQLLNRWWKRYTKQAQESVENGDFPSLIQKYLVSTLARRLGLPAIALGAKEKDSETESQPLKTLALLAAIEPLRDEILDSVLAGATSDEVDDQPLPTAPQWQALDLPAMNEPPAIEPLAATVPPDCFYLRFGAFNNYVWFQELSERFGGDIGQAVLLRGFNYEASQRMERMLATKMTTLAKMFGDQLINDMAVIGHDLYMKEGASLGVVFRANNPGILRSAMDSDRKSIAKQNPEASLQEIEIDGKQVSLLSTPDNRIRSFMLVSEQTMIVTTSRQIIESFIEVSRGGPSLADQVAFQWAREWMPAENNYSVYGYFSPDFFHHLVSPQYQIELRRRLEAIAHLEMVAVATQAAEAEGLATDSLDDLRDGGFVPYGFDERVDGARLLRTGDGWIDSRRGARGSFLPIADVDVGGVSRREADEYAALAEFYQREWRAMDPMMFGIRRFSTDSPGVEQVALEGYLAPFVPEKYGWLGSLLASPTSVAIRQPEDDVISLQACMRGSLDPGPLAGSYHLFGGIKDMRPPAPGEVEGLLKTLQALRAMPAYIGAWPKPGWIDSIPLLRGASVDYNGFSRMLGGLWRWQGDGFSLLSFNRLILEDAIGQLEPLQTQDQAQLRIRVQDLSRSQLRGWINDYWYGRGWQASQGNARLLDAMTEQLHVPSEECLPVAEELLDVRLQCPLGGEYVYQTTASDTTGRRESGRWISTAWESAIWSSPEAVADSAQPRAPSGYQAPWIQWFRGGELRITQFPSQLAVIGSLDLELPPIPANRRAEQEDADSLQPIQVDLFQLPFKMFGQDSQPDEDRPKRRDF